MIRPVDVKVIDTNSEYRGVPAAKLMENAAEAIVKQIEEFGWKKVLFICGPGNNGGDGLAAARQLFASSKEVSVMLPDSFSSELSKNNYSHLPKSISRLKISELAENRQLLRETIESFELIVDCMFGAGISKPLQHPYRTIVEAINAFSPFTMCVDMPSGLGTPLYVKANVTITFIDAKTGMNENNCGTIITVPIGVPDDAMIYTGPGEMHLFPLPRKNSYKGDNGKLLIIGGGEFTGAPALAAFGALKAGCDIVTVVVPEEIKNVVASFSPELMVKSAEKSDLYALMSSHHAILAGPGVGNHQGMGMILKNLIIECPAVIDTSVMCNIEIPTGSIITPHHGEFFRLTAKHLPEKMEERIKIVSEEAKKRSCTILSKGPCDIISDGIKTKLNPFGSPGMTVGGTGDVLAGIVASLLSRGLDSFDSGVLGAYIAGKAGEISYKKYGVSMTALDFISTIPEAIMEEFSALNIKL